MPLMDLHPDSAVIDALGGPTAVGALFEISPQAVSQWRRSGIPKPRRMYLRLVQPQAFPTDSAASMGGAASDQQGLSHAA